MDDDHLGGPSVHQAERAMRKASAAYRAAVVELRRVAGDPIKARGVTVLRQGELEASTGALARAELRRRVARKALHAAAEALALAELDASASS